MISKQLNSVSPDIRRTKQQAIYLGLVSVLTEEQAEAALESWSTFFNETGSIFTGINNFAREVCRRYDKDDQQRTLVRALNRALIYVDTNAAPMIIKEAIKIKAAVTTASDINDTEEPADIIESPISTPAFQTFQYLLIKIINLVEPFKNESHLSLHGFLNELIHSMPWSESQQKQVITLINTGTTTQIRACQPDQLKSFLQHLRSWMEDDLGQANANRLITEAVMAVQLLPVSINYAATKFL
jgi:hypothetical protein